MRARDDREVAARARNERERTTPPREDPESFSLCLALERCYVVDHCAECELARELLESMYKPTDDGPGEVVATFATEDAANPHLITTGRDSGGAFIYPFLECDELCADMPAGEALLLYRHPQSEGERSP